MSVSRRCFLRSSVAAIGGVGLASVMTREASAKVAPHLVGYQPMPKGAQNCANCKLFLVPDACKSVEGPVSPNGWCKIWIKV